MLSNQQCILQPTLTNLHPNEYSQKFHYYPFSVKLDRYTGSSNTLNDLSNKVWIPNKTEDLNLIVFSTFTEINESKTLTKHTSCKWKCKFDGRSCNSDQWWNNGKCWCKSKKRHVCEKDYVWNPTTCNCENGKYQACDEIIEETLPTNLNEKSNL